MMIAFALVIFTVLVLPLLLGKSEPPAEFTSDAEPLPNIVSPSVYVSRKTETLFDVYNDYGFTNPGPQEHVASFAKQRPAPPITPTSWGSHSHFLPGSEEKE